MKYPSNNILNVVKNTNYLRKNSYCINCFISVGNIGLTDIHLFMHRFETRSGKNKNLRPQIYRLNIVRLLFIKIFETL